MLHSGGENLTNGVALIIRSPLDSALVSWRPISDRLLVARFAHRHGHLSVIVCYAPTELAEDSTKDTFYNQLSAVTQSIPPHDIMTILGDFNASPDIPDGYADIIGPFSSGTRNDNSERLLSFCGMHGLLFPGT